MELNGAVTGLMGLSKKEHIANQEQIGYGVPSVAVKAIAIRLSR
jgi:hypothetical protein